MKIISRSSWAFALLMCLSLPAQAVPITWTLQNVQTIAGPDLIGSFDYDADTDVYSNVNILGALSTYVFDAGNPSSSATVAVFADSFFVFGLVLTFVNALTNTGGVEDIVGFSSYEGLCIPTCSAQVLPLAEILSGQVTSPGVDMPVPEPGTLGLLGAGLIGLVWRRRRAA